MKKVLFLAALSTLMACTNEDVLVNDMKDEIQVR